MSTSHKLAKTRRLLAQARRDQNPTLVRFLQGQIDTFQKDLHSTKDRRRKTSYEEQSKGY